MITIQKVETKKQIKQFVLFKHALYQDDPNYVPELNVSQYELLDKEKFPFFLHSKADFFLAFENEKVVGRIAAIRNNNYNSFANVNVGFFGFFDTIEKYEVAEKLFQTAEKWCKDENLDSILGPDNYSTNETCGLLVNAFDSPPVVMMTYNKPYYIDFVEKYGFKTKMNLIAYNVIKEKIPERLLKASFDLEKRLNEKGIIIRKINMKNFDEEVKSVKKIYNSAWAKNWGFVPMTNHEFDHLAKELKMIINPEYTLIAEHNSEVIGFSLTIPDINKILIKIRNGKLFPFGIIKLLYYKNKIKSLRIITLGIIESYRRLGIDTCFYAKTCQTAFQNNIESAEASWILENNQMMNRALINMNAVPYKTYRIYEKIVS